MVAAARPRPVVLAAIACGGMIGATARHVLAQAVPNPATGFPTATLAVNVVGSFLLGAFAARSADLPAGMRHLRPFLAVGMLGSFTTFSTFAVESVVLVDRGDAFTAAISVPTMIGAGICAAWLGLGAGRWFDRGSAAS